MSQGHFRTPGNRAKVDFDQGLAGILSVQPPPAHCQTSGFDDLEILAVGLMLDAVEPTEADTKAPADAQVSLGQKHRAGIRPPPGGYALRRCECVKDNRRPRGNPADERETRHRRCFLASASL